MANKNKTRKNQPKRRYRSRPNNRVRSGKSSSKSSGIGTILHNGIRSVLAMLPGAAVTSKLADAIFTTLGWSETLQTSGTAVTADVSIFGLSTAFYLTPKMFLGDAICAATSEITSSPHPETRSIRINYATSRLSSVVVSARNAGPASVHGYWGIGFWPFPSHKTEDEFVNVFGGVELSDIRQAPFYVDGPASKPLTLRHYFTSSEMYLRIPGDHDKWYGVIAIAYSDHNRSSYTDFSASDFDPQIEIKGTVVLSARKPNAPILTNNLIDSHVQKIAAMIKHPLGQVFVQRDDKFKCAHEAGQSFCKIEGISTSITPAPAGFEMMAIE